MCERVKDEALCCGWMCGLQDSAEFLLEHHRKVYACCTTGCHVVRLVLPDGSRRVTAANSHVSSDRFARTKNPTANPSNPLTVTRNVGLDEGSREAVRAVRLRRGRVEHPETFKCTHIVSW